MPYNKNKNNMIKITLNEKEYQLPDSWMDVTIGQFQDLNNIDVDYDNITKNMSIISILAGCSIDELLDLPAIEYNKLCELITFLDSQIPDKICDEWTFNDITYKYDAEITQYNVSMFLDLDAMSKGGVDNLHLLLAIMYRPFKDNKIGKYRANEVVERAKLFQENMPVSIAVAAQLFMSAFLINSIQIMKASLVEEKKPQD